MRAMWFLRMDARFGSLSAVIVLEWLMLRAWAMTVRGDFTSQSFFRDPAAGVEKLRALGPVVATRFPIVGKVWITTTYESTARVLKDSETFTLRKEGGGVAGLRWWMPAFVSAPGQLFAN